MVTERKIQTVKRFEELLGSNDVVGVIAMEGIPAPQLQQIKGDLRPEAVVKMGKNTLILRALDSQGFSELDDYVEFQTALIFTDMNPFKLYKKLEAGKTNAPASPGSIAPKDIVVPAGETGLPPGPVVGDLQQAGIPASIEGGGVVVQEDTTVAEAGDEIDTQLADVLNKLGIKPLEIGLTLRAVYEDGSIFEPEVLAIDEEQYAADFQAAAAQAFNLAVNAAIPTTESLPTLVGKAAREARSLAIGAEVLSSEVIEELLAKADGQALGLRSALGEEFEESGSVSSGTSEAAEEKKGEKTEESEEEGEEDSSSEASSGE